jgi:hypothetical protein
MADYYIYTNAVTNILHFAQVIQAQTATGAKKRGQRLYPGSVVMVTTIGFQQTYHVISKSSLGYDFGNGNIQGFEFQKLGTVQAPTKKIADRIAADTFGSGIRVRENLTNKEYSVTVKNRHTGLRGIHCHQCIHEQNKTWANKLMRAIIYPLPTNSAVVDFKVVTRV